MQKLRKTTQKTESTSCSTPDSPHEDPPTGTQETPPQRATTRQTAVALLGKWRRTHALKILVAAVLSHKTQNQRHNAFKNWIQCTKTKINTANLAARTVHTFPAEALRKWQCPGFNSDKRHTSKNAVSALKARLNTQAKTLHFNNWWQHAQYSSAARLPHVQLFLRGAAASTLTITVPVPVTRNHLHNIIAKKTLVPPQQQSLGTMYQYADAKNADLFYMQNYCTIDISLLLKGGSGGPGRAKQVKPQPQQPQKFFIYVQGPDQHHNTVMVLPSDRIRQVKELLAKWVILQPSSQTLFLRGNQLDDNLTLQDGDITQGTTLQLLRVSPPDNCEEHHKRRLPEHLWQRYDPDLKRWIWVCCPSATCRLSQNDAGAATNALTQHPVPPRAKRTPTLSQRLTAAPETPSGPQLQTPMPDASTPHAVGTRVYARYDGDDEEYPATILGNYTGGHLIAYDIEPTIPYRVRTAYVRPAPRTLATSALLAPGKGICGLHHKPRNIKNLTWQLNPNTETSQMICKPGQECASRPERLGNAEHHAPHTGSDTAASQNNMETGTDDTSSTSSWDGTSKQRLSVSTKAMVNDR
jgi:hypothetical protein